MPENTRSVLLTGDTELTRLKRKMRAAGATQLYFKRLADNDNSKNQVYLGPDLSALNVLPIRGIVSDPENPQRLKAPLNFGWLSESGNVTSAPGAQLILYPDYPEVRFSGFLKRCQAAPSPLMRIRQAGRLLFFGITVTGEVIGYVTPPGSALSNEVQQMNLQPSVGVFVQLSITDLADDRLALLLALKSIADAGWITSRRLTSNGSSVPCNSPNCGGYTLEAELGIRPNGYSEPDYQGWEIKQHSVSNLDRIASGGAITLMTPEPTGGVYAEEGVGQFIRRFGYADSTIPDRRNFGGIHTAARVCSATNLTLTLSGYDADEQVITDNSGGISLRCADGEVAASWPYAGLLVHWNRKHAKAAYIPSINRTAPERQYRYGNRVRLAVGTDFLLFLKAVAQGVVYYDPGIKMENVSGPNPRIKRRSQFRIRSSQIPALYKTVEEVDVSSSN